MLNKTAAKKAAKDTIIFLLVIISVVFILFMLYIMIEYAPILIIPFMFTVAAGAYFSLKYEYYKERAWLND